MGETLTLLFRRRGDNTFELQARDSWSGRTVSGDFFPPYTPKQLNHLLKRLSQLESSDQELIRAGQRLFLALCGAKAATEYEMKPTGSSVDTLVRGVIQRALKRRGTVALTLGFDPGCDEFVRYPWELLNNGDHFLLVSGIFTLSRALLRPDLPFSCELPVQPPMRVLYIGVSPSDCAPLEIESSYEALERAFAPLIENGQVLLDRLEPPTFDQLVRYFNSYGGANMLNDSSTTMPCYVVHFDGHGAYGRLCPNDECEVVNEPPARKCTKCGEALSRVEPQTYLCFCDDAGCNRYIDTQSLRDLFLSSDVRLAVFSACETATVASEASRRRRRVAVDTMLATSLVTAQVPAVVAMPFSLQDDLSPTFIFHFYEALADGRTLEEGLTRARQALLPMQHRSWFIPVLYRRITEGQESPVPLLQNRDAPDEREHPLAYLAVPSSFVGRERELRELDKLFETVFEHGGTAGSRVRPHTVLHHFALTGSPGIGKSTLAFEFVRLHRHKFPGGIIGVSLQDGKPFGDALLEIIHHLHATTQPAPLTDVGRRERWILNTLRALASRELPFLLLLDSFEEVKDRNELEAWGSFLCSLPPEVVVLVTSRSNPESMLGMKGAHCRWYEYRVEKMTKEDLLSLFSELAMSSGLDQRIHLDDPAQQVILREICELLDGYPLGAELIFGTARPIGGRVYTPEAATRSLEEVRDELRDTPLAGILAVLEVSYRRLTPLARLLLAYLSTFKLPFSREQIAVLITPETLGSMDKPVPLVQEQEGGYEGEEQAGPQPVEVIPAQLVTHWRSARDELVQSSFMQFDGHLYTIHTQVRHFALSHLPIEERRRIHRVVAAYYYNLPHPGPEEWFVAFEHLESAGETQDLQEAVRVAVEASWALNGKGWAQELLTVLRRAGVHASMVGDRTGEGKIQCCLGAILRHLGRYIEAESCLRSSLTFHTQQDEHSEAGWAAYELATLFCEEGNFDEADTTAHTALQLFSNAGDARGEAWARLVIGKVKRHLGAYHDALNAFEEVLGYFRTLRDEEGIASAWRERGTTNEALGRYAKALNDYEEARRLFSTLEIRSGLAWTLVDIGLAYANQGKLDAAERMCHEALTIFREQGVRRGEGWALYVAGKIMRGRRDMVKAREYYEGANALFSSVGNRVDQARVLNSLGTIALSENEYLEAKELYEHAQIIAQEQRARTIECRALMGLGEVAYALRRYMEAHHHYHEAAALAAELDIPAERCAILRRQGLLEQAQKKYTEALQHWIQALALDQRLHHPVRTDLQKLVDALVEEHHLGDIYTELCEQYGLS